MDTVLIAKAIGFSLFVGAGLVAASNNRTGSVVMMVFLAWCCLNG